MARIAWDIIDSKFQRKGIGKQLVLYRITHLQKLYPPIEIIIVRTSQIVYTFYEIFGFEVDRIEMNFWATGFHLYQMQRKK